MCFEKIPIQVLLIAQGHCQKEEKIRVLDTLKFEDFQVKEVFLGFPSRILGSPSMSSRGGNELLH